MLLTSDYMLKIGIIHALYIRLVTHTSHPLLDLIICLIKFKLISITIKLSSSSSYFIIDLYTSVHIYFCFFHLKYIKHIITHSLLKEQIIFYSTTNTKYKIINK